MITMTLDKRFKIETTHGVYIFDIGDEIYFKIDNTKKWMAVFRYSEKHEDNFNLYIPEFLRGRTKTFIEQFWVNVSKRSRNNGVSYL